MKDINRLVIEVLNGKVKAVHTDIEKDFDLEIWDWSDCGPNEKELEGPFEQSILKLRNILR